MKCAFFSLPCLRWHSADVFIRLITLNALKSNEIHVKVAETVSDTYDLLFSYKKVSSRLCLFNSRYFT